MLKVQVGKFAALLLLVQSCFFNDPGGSGGMHGLSTSCRTSSSHWDCSLTSSAASCDLLTCSEAVMCNNPCGKWRCGIAVVLGVGSHHLDPDPIVRSYEQRYVISVWHAAVVHPQ